MFKKTNMAPAVSKRYRNLGGESSTIFPSAKRKNRQSEQKKAQVIFVGLFSGWRLSEAGWRHLLKVRYGPSFWAQEKLRFTLPLAFHPWEMTVP